MNYVKTKINGKLKKLISAAVIGAVAISFPVSVNAGRIHDPKVETKVETEHQPDKNKTVNLTSKRGVKNSNDETKTKRGTLQDRIKAILNPEGAARMTIETEEAAEKFIVKPTVSISDTSIIGTPMASQKQCVQYLLKNNPYPNIAVSPEEIVAYYYEEGEREGIRPDVAFAQALKETGFFRYGGTVTPDQNNFCGLGTTSATVKGSYFPNPQIGVRAHIQHLLAYSSTRKPTTTIVDPRYTLVRKAYGSRTLGQWYDLNGRWAVPGNHYGQEILSMFNAILRQ